MDRGVSHNDKEVSSPRRHSYLLVYESNNSIETCEAKTDRITRSKGLSTTIVGDIITP